MAMLLSRIGAALILVVCTANGVSAQAFPNKPVRVILPFAAGSGADVVTRVVTQKLSEGWGQPVVVDNRPGAGGTIGVAAVAKSTPDGYVLLAHSSTYAVSPALYASLPYDPAKDLVELAPIGTQPYVLVVGPSSGFKTLADLTAAAKQKPGETNFGSAGLGSSSHLVAEKFRTAAGIDVVHVPYKNFVDANTDTATGCIAFWFPPMGLALPLVRGGKLLALGVTSARRSAHLPHVPTLSEAAIAGIEDTNWFGMWAPGRMPAELVSKIANEVTAAVAAAEVRERLSSSGTDPLSMTQPEFARFVRAEIETAARVVKSAGIRPE
jgi:tripartite-type tricarboxylate transporter receptor subunit TctC